MRIEDNIYLDIIVNIWERSELMIDISDSLHDGQHLELVYIDPEGFLIANGEFEMEDHDNKFDIFLRGMDFNDNYALKLFDEGAL